MLFVDSVECFAFDSSFREFGFPKIDESSARKRDFFLSDDLSSSLLAPEVVRVTSGSLPVVVSAVVSQSEVMFMFSLSCDDFLLG